jgi:hypothetical protein
MVDGLITDYFAQMSWAYNRDVVHPEAARQRGWLQELRLARPESSGRRWWAGVLAASRRTGPDAGRAAHASTAGAEGAWATGAERSAR